MTPDELEQRIRAAGRAVSLAGLVRETVAAEVLGIAPRTLRRLGLRPRAAWTVLRAARAVLRDDERVLH
jgi:hypothetical protein